MVVIGWLLNTTNDLLGRVISEQKLSESEGRLDHPITSLFRGQLYEINEQKREVYRKYYEPYN